MSHYAGNMHPRHSINHLFNLKQNSRQPLCKLIHHFVTEIMQVESDDPKTAIVALKKALLLGSPLQRSLAKSRLVTMEALLSKANRYVNMKEEIRVVESRRKMSQVEHTQV